MGGVRYRINVLSRTEDSFRDFTTNNNRFFIAPTFRIDIGDRTDLTLNLEYSEDQRPSDFGLVAIGDRVADVPLGRAIGELDDETNTEFFRVGYNFEHRFSEDWKLRNAFYLTHYDSEFFSSFGVRPLDETTGIQVRAPIFLKQPSTTYELQTNVVGEFATGFVEHTLLIGVDLARRDQLDNVGNINPMAARPFNIFDPVYGTITRVNPETDPILFEGSNQLDSLGIYLQDQVKLLDNLKLLAGVRYDTTRQENITLPSFFVATKTEETQNDDALTPRVGLVYQPIEPVSLYASYSQSFVPNNAMAVTGEFLEVERGEQIEVGVRAELLGGSFITSLAYFNITKENVATPDPNNVLFSIASGKQRSRGIELDAMGEILPGWNLIANYAYIDSKITEDNGGLEGNRLFNVPEHNANLWTTYEIQGGPLRGLTLGGGLNFVSERFGDNENSFKLDSYFLTNAVIAYERDGWRGSVNFRNLFDIDYIEGTENSRTGEINPGEGFTVIGSLSVEF